MTWLNLESCTSGNDVWLSDDGATWTLATAHAPVAARWGLASVLFDGRVWFPPRMNAGGVSFDGRIWILGGSERGVRNDVWWSK